MNSLIPILIALITTSGSVATANLIQPIILFIIIFIGNIVTYVLIPVITSATIISIVANISDKIQVDKISNFLKSGVVWILGIIVTVFVGVISLEGTLTSSVDGLSIKGIKAVSSNVIPFIGKALSDSVETVLGCTTVLKNSVGIVRNDSSSINLHITNYKTYNINSNVCTNHCNCRTYSG